MEWFAKKLTKTMAMRVGAAINIPMKYQNHRDIIRHCRCTAPDVAAEPIITTCHHHRLPAPTLITGAAQEVRGTAK